MSTSNRTAESEDFSGATRRLAHDIRLRVEREQQGVATFADQMLLAFAAHLESGGEADDGHAREALARLTRLVARRAEGRYVDYDTRLQGAGTDGARDIGYFEMVTSQSEMGCLKWKGKPLFKTVYDFSLYPMLVWELRPATIIELGSGLGTSAVWLVDVAAAFALEPHLYSVDLQPPPLRDKRITFIEGDCEAIDSALPEEMLRSMPHPWLVIQRYQGAASVDAWGITENVNIQYYAPGGGYKIWHCERWGKDMPQAARHLVFMTYVNDVSDGGGTEVLYQRVTVQPKKGLTLIWPADWTRARCSSFPARIAIPALALTLHGPGA